MSIALYQDEKLSVVRLDGDADIAAAAELKASLLAALEAGKGIRVSMTSATAFDVTVFQLLWAAKQEAARRGLEFLVTGGRNESLQTSLKDMGLNGLLSDLGASELVPCEIGVPAEGE